MHPPYHDIIKFSKYLALVIGDMKKQEEKETSKTYGVIMPRLEVFIFSSMSI